MASLGHDGLSQVTATYLKIFKENLQWRHNGGDGVSNHQPHDCLLNCLFKRRSKKTSKLRVTDLCVGNSPVIGELPAQRASNVEKVSIWLRHHGVAATWLSWEYHIYLECSPSNVYQTTWHCKLTDYISSTATVNGHQTTKTTMEVHNGEMANIKAQRHCHGDHQIYTNDINVCMWCDIRGLLCRLYSIRCAFVHLIFYQVNTHDKTS